MVQIISKGLFLIGFVDPNKYVWSSLVGAIESDQLLLDHYKIQTTPYHLYEAPLFEAEFSKIPFQEYDFVLMGYSLLSSQLDHLSEFQKACPNYFQKYHQKIYTIAGGPHAAAHPDSLGKFGFDFIVPGEGEDILIEILHRFLNEPIEQIKANPPRGVAVGIPHYVPASMREEVQIGKYPCYAEKQRLFGPILLSRGCPHKCKYCQTGNNTRLMRHVPEDIVIAWVKRAVEIKYKRLWFLTPNAFAYGSKNGIKPNITALDNLLTGLNTIPNVKEINFGTFPAEVRPEFVTREILEVVKPKITNKYFVVGAQNASDRLLKYINRGHTFADVINAINLLKEFDYSADIDFIFGLPGENEEDIQANLRFFEDVYNKKYTNVRIHTHTFMPLPGTPFENEPLGIVDKRVQRIVGQLATEGLAFGEFLAQANMVERRCSKKLFK